MSLDYTMIPIAKARLPKGFFDNWDQMTEHDRIAYIMGRIDRCDMNIEEIQKMLDDVCLETMEDDDE